ncbi:hypothetical protein [Engelhardtia mirabilis]|uniref:6-phospho-alpha-glucosidase n=1 Tax=Engelhardtia mirabilis TaxID=2528011 RepID=A0A518BF89_9BACT|nr:6-phospho-alpha-glucosidase [Planctomycetes bacterium Pla133]QDU99974.1 6-phospho-alpha-glucosidase [Planctomycetes bacterium Pla86]
MPYANSTHSERRRIAVLGGSSAFTPQLAEALGQRAAHLPRLELVLLGRRARATAATARFCDLVARAAGADHVYAATTDPDQALDRADLVLMGVRVGGFAGREEDERIGHDLDLPGDETIGPGGLAAAVRSLPVVLDLARRAARLSPGAPTICLSNPLGILVAALEQEPGVRALGLCELPEATLRSACEVAGLDALEVDADYIGLNHQGAFTAVRDGTGRDRLPELLAAIAALPDAREFGVEPAAMARREDLPLSYLRLYEHRARELERQRTRGRSRGAELAAIAGELHAHFATAQDARLPEPLLSRQMPWNELAVVPALESLFDGRPRRLAITCANRGFLPGIDDGAPVEKWGLQVPFGAPPPSPVIEGPAAARALAFAELLAGFERAALAAARAPSAGAIEAALAAHPWGIPQDSRRTLAARIADSVRPSDSAVTIAEASR